MLKSYVKRVFEVAKRGDAREESYYSSLEGLFKAFADSINKKHIHVTTLPKKTEAGNPDFRVWDGKQNIVGYIEAKKPTEENLDYIEDTEQLKRYLKTFPNLILTNFFEFRLYRNSQLIDKVLIARPFVIHKLRTTPPIEKEEEFINLLDQFFAFSLPRTYTAKSLAIELAKRTRFLKDQVIIEELKEEEEKGEGFILGFYEAFQKYLIGGLTKEDFADLYAQTITYGLFAARTRSENGFNRKMAFDNIPRTIGILRDVFRYISLEDLPPQLEWIVDDISEVLAVADVNQILRKFYHEGKGSDPIIHFYETFLAEYDPAERERRGVYYTPEPVVSYIVRSLNIVLKEHFGRQDGFASNSVTVLDPASGTLTFLAEAAKLAIEEFVAKYGEGGTQNLIEDHILKNFYAFELMMAPYAVGHLKMSFLLEELGYKLQKDDRFKLYLTNTLEMEELEQTSLPGMSSLAEESHLAGKIKKKTPILVILGNPPYSGHSANVSEKYITEIKKGKERKRKIKTWIGNLIEDYKRVDGKPLGEKNPKWLQDDYVKFIRFAQWKIDQAGEGILGFITNHSYLDNPTFRGMRQSSITSFNEIYLLDLHGSSLKKEKCPDGSKDENVFDIRQGVAIALFIKRKDRGKERKIYHSEIWGLREKKYGWLLENNLKTTNWRDVSPKPEYYLFVPRDEKLLQLYENNPKITDIFQYNNVGIVTARDKLTIQRTPEEIWNIVLAFSKMDQNRAREGYDLGKDVRDWKVELAQKDLLESGPRKDLIVRILYRPFDIRYTYYTGRSRGFHCMPRPGVMRHMMAENLALCIGRAGQVVGLEKPWNIVFCSDCIEDFNLFYRGGNVNFPLYLYSNAEQKDLFAYTDSREKRKPNLNPKVLQTLSETYKTKLSPEEIFYYIYATLHSNTYRTKYAEFLKIDFPRVPFTSNYDLFIKMGKYGERLVDLHLLKATELSNPIAKFQGSGDYRMDKQKYNEDERRVYINKDQYFEGIDKAVWEYQIGGYQVLDKWLKDRKGGTLSLDDIKHYCKVVTALKKTIEIQEDIDGLYPNIEKEVVEFKTST